MGDIRILKEQVEIGVPLESAALLAGYDFEEIAVLDDDREIQFITKLANANIMSKHLVNINVHSDVNPRMSTWLLERLFPDRFANTSKIVDKSNEPPIPTSISLKGADDE